MQGLPFSIIKVKVHQNKEQEELVVTLKSEKAEYSVKSLR